MNRHHDRNHEMGLQDFFTWRSQALANTPAVDEEVPADVDEPPDHRTPRDHQVYPDLYKSTIRPNNDRKESLLTKALTKNPKPETFKTDIHVTTDLTRRRSMISNASLASTAELTSDGGLTSPARTNTPSPPLPANNYTSFAPYSFAQKSIHQPEPLIVKVESRNPAPAPEVNLSISPKTEVQVEVAPQKKRCITFACGGRKDAAPKPKPAPTIEQKTAPVGVEPHKRRACTIKFACPGPKAEEKEKATKAESPKNTQTLKPAVETPRRTSRSPSAARKSPRVIQSPRIHRDSTSTVRRTSQSPTAARAKPKYIVADEKSLESSEATRFHEFASGELQEDDWIRRDADVPRARLTINDTLMKENAIRRLGNEAEEEALEEEEDEDEAGNDSDDENDDEDDDEDEDEDEEDSLDGSDEDVSDGNETDNEAGFADSDESDAEGEFAFWTPGRTLNHRNSNKASTYRASAHRTASASSIDSLNHMSPPKETKRLRRRPIKIRPGTPDLPDSTDFVCGTLDEDRPLEDAYVSCMEARKNAKHKQCPQDIDPSFPTSDPENEEDEEDIVDTAKSSDEHVWLHGNFEDSDEEPHGRRRSIALSPRRLHSPPPPRRLHSPPPAKQRLRSPPPRKLFGGQSPKRMRSPQPARTLRSPAASPTSHTTIRAINFAPLGSRPGLTHTKSLPRTPNAFCRQYRASRLAAANGNDGSDAFDGHTRGAMDILQGLDRKRQRRKEKFHQKQGNRKSKDHTERKPQPGKGAERMRELGLLMAGNKTGIQDPYMLSA